MGKLQGNKNRNDLNFYKNFEKKEFYRKVDKNPQININIFKDYREPVHQKTSEPHPVHKHPHSNKIQDCLLVQIQKAIRVQNG